MWGHGKTLFLDEIDDALSPVLVRFDPIEQPSQHYECVVESTGLLECQMAMGPFLVTAPLRNFLHRTLPLSPSEQTNARASLYE